MNRFVRFYNQYRKIFWTIVFAIILIVITLQALNNYAKESKQNSSGINNTTTYNNIQNPAIVGDNIKEQTSIKLTQIIDSFIKYCNNGEIDEAYNLLSDDCKRVVFPTVEEFKNKYYNKIFETYRIYNLTAWISNNGYITYRVEILEDILSTGNTSEINIEDYYTIVKQNNEYKLNIGNYVKTEKINKVASLENTNFMVLERDVFINYEIYKMKVENNTNKRILVDSKKNTKTAYVTDQNDVKYIAFLNEISKNDLTILSGMSKEINIKFNKEYNPNYKDNYIEFTDIILDENNLNQRSNIKIEL